MTEEELKKYLFDLEGFDFEAFELENEFSAKGILKAMDEYAQQAVAEHEASQWKKYVDLLSEIEAWLCFNTTPSSEDTANVRKSINVLLGKK